MHEKHPYSIDHCIIHQDGSERNVHEEAEVFYDESGEPVRMVGTVHDITERKKAVDAIRKSEEKYRRLIDNLSDVVIEADSEGNFIYVSPQVKDIFGYEPEEIIGKNVIEFIHPDDNEKTNKVMTGLLSGKEIVAFEYRSIHKDGYYLPISGSVKVIGEGKDLRLIAILRDITERKLAEEAIRESEEKFRSISATAQDAIVMVDIKGKINYWNDAAKKIFRYSDQDFQEANLHDCILPSANYEANKKGLNKLLINDQNKSLGKTLEMKGIKKDGAEFPLELSMSAVNIKGKWNAVSIIRDITERKQADEALRESELRYRSFVENFPGIAFRTDMNLEPIFFHGAVEEITGYKEEQLVEGARNWDKIFHPSDLPRFKKSVEKLFSNPANFIEEEYRIIHKNGQIRWVNGIIQCIRDDSDKRISLQGTLYDITEHKYAEEALKESEQRFRTIYNNAMDGILLTDIETKKFYTGNDTICNMLGYSLEELQSLYVIDIHPNKDLPYVIEEFTKQIKGESTLAKNIPIIKKNGNIIFMDINSSEIVLAGNKYLMGVYRDVTERKLAEEERRELFKQKTRAELHGFMVSALPVFTAGVTSQVRDTLVATFTDRFDETFKPKFNEEIGLLCNENGIVEPEIMYEFYLNWVSEFFSNLGVICNCNREGSKASIEFINCPWKDDARGNPIFCLICRAIMMASFNWTSIEGTVNHISSIAGESKSCKFEFQLFNFTHNLEKTIDLCESVKM